MVGKRCACPTIGLCPAKSEWLHVCGSKRSAITPQPDCYGNEHRGNYQSEPKTGRAQVRAGSESWAVDRVHLKSKCLRCESHQPVLQHRAKMRGAACDSLEKRDSE